jgi:sugar phosphate isomerase/epimerase
MYLTGFADEAAVGIEGQIRATQALGWTHIESRNVGGKNIHDIPDAEFDAVAANLQNAGVRVNCFGSAIANWGKKIEDPFEVTLEEVRRAIPRMQRLGTPLIRIMSYAIRKDHAPEDQMEEERFRRLREIVGMFLDAGLTPLHENCMNYGGMGWPFTLRLLENVPGLKLVFDTANPVNTDDYAKPPPRPKQSAWEFYSHVREYVAYVHVKDARFVAEQAGSIFPKSEHVWPGEGQGDVRRILKDLLARGYDGGISIEPHLAVVFHDASVRSPEQVRFDNYVEYGRRLMRMLDDIRREFATPVA